MSQFVTATEAWVIAQAQGRKSVMVDYNGELAQFCGLCGRLIHHPDCPRHPTSKPQDDQP